jgi:hypothetical protein
MNAKKTKYLLLYMKIVWNMLFTTQLQVCENLKSVGAF